MEISYLYPQATHRKNAVGLLVLITPKMRFLIICTIGFLIVMLTLTELSQFMFIPMAIMERVIIMEEQSTILLLESKGRL